MFIELYDYHQTGKTASALRIVAGQLIGQEIGQAVIFGDLSDDAVIEMMVDCWPGSVSAKNGLESVLRGAFTQGNLRIESAVVTYTDLVNHINELAEYPQGSTLVVTGNILIDLPDDGHRPANALESIRVLRSLAALKRVNVIVEVPLFAPEELPWETDEEQETSDV